MTMYPQHEAADKSMYDVNTDLGGTSDKNGLSDKGNKR